MPTKTFFDLKEDKRNRILDAARRVFVTDTYEKVSIQDIIKEANIPRGSFYQYFEDKDDLFLYCLREVHRKCLEIIYRDNMDYYWNVLYNEHPEKKSEMPWESLAIEQMKQVLTKDEFTFAMNLSEVKGNTLLSSYSDEAMIFYPLLLKHLKASGTISDPEKLDLVAFMFSHGDMLCYEYANLKNISFSDAFLYIQPAIRAFYEVFRDKPSEGNPDQLQSLVSLHLLSADGLDMTLTLAPGHSWEFESTNGLTRRKVQIMMESLAGRLLIDARGTQLCGQDRPDALTITVDAQGDATCSLVLGGLGYDLGAGLTVLGTTSDGTRICVMDGGKYLL